jgi:hypothetical protein
MTNKILNPKTGRYILPGKRTYINLLKEGYSHDPQTNSLILSQRNHIGGNVSLLDEDVPDIGVVPLKPTQYTLVKEKVSKIIRTKQKK